MSNDSLFFHLVLTLFFYEALFKEDQIYLILKVCSPVLILSIMNWRPEAVKGAGRKDSMWEKGKHTQQHPGLHLGWARPCQGRTGEHPSFCVESLLVVGDRREHLSVDQSALCWTVMKWCPKKSRSCWGIRKKFTVKTVWFAFGPS